MPLSVSSWQSSVSHSLTSVLAAPVWGYDSGGRRREGGRVYDTCGGGRGWEGRTGVCVCEVCMCCIHKKNLQVLVILQFSTAQQRHQAPSAQLSVGAKIPNNAHH